MASNWIHSGLKDSYKGKIVDGFSQLIREEQLGLMPLKEVFKIVEGVKGKMQVGYIGEIEKITRKDTGCGMEAIDATPSTRLLQWDPVHLKVVAKMCFHDYSNTFLEWGLNNGIKRQDLTRDDYFLFIADLIKGAILKDFTRLVFFGKKDANVGSPLKSGEKQEDWNQFDGFYETMFKELTTNSSRHHEIEANNKSTYAEQKALGADEGFKAFEALLEMADYRMLANPQKLVILSTYELAKNVSRYMRETYRDEKTFSRLENGFMVSEFNGIKVVTNPWLDYTIKSSFDNGTKWDKPHRAFLIDPSNNQIGLDSENALKDLVIEYIGGADEHNYIKGSYTADFKRAIPEFGTGAY